MPIHSYSCVPLPPLVLLSVSVLPLLGGRAGGPLVASAKTHREAGYSWKSPGIQYLGGWLDVDWLHGLKEPPRLNITGWQQYGNILALAGVIQLWQKPGGNILQYY